MTGMDAHTGRALHGLAHLRQSIADILTTPIGTRLARRDYGSLLPALIDQPASGATRVRLFAATAGALMRWEPRLRLTRVGLVQGPRPGQWVVELHGTLAGAQAGAQADDVPLPSALPLLTLPLPALPRSAP